MRTGKSVHWSDIFGPKCACKKTPQGRHEKTIVALQYALLARELNGSQTQTCRLRQTACAGNYLLEVSASTRLGIPPEESREISSTS